MPRDLTMFTKDKAIRRRFFKQVAFCVHSKSCTVCHWLWKGSISSNGYGSFHVCMLSYTPYERIKATPHRFMYTIAYGHTSKLVLHSCDIPNCCNYNHLFSGSNKENSEDMVNKGRSAKGENNGRAKLTPDIIWHVKVLRESNYTLKDIGLIVGVSLQQVHNVLSGKAWKHLSQ